MTSPEGGAFVLDIADANGPARRYRVLVVDDTADVRQLARMTLAASGFEVFDTASGVEACLMAEQLRPDCVILDVSMPDMSGIEVCRALRHDPANSGCTILMLTGNSDADQKTDAFSGGADDYIIKPFSPRDLVSRVRAALRLHHTGRHTWPLVAPGPARPPVP